jgi:hypothetical protein
LRDRVVAKVGGRNREIERELSGASGLSSETENRAVRAQHSVWAVKNKVRAAWGLWEVGCMLLRWWACAVAREPASKHK